MRVHRGLTFFLSLLLVSALAVSARAQQAAPPAAAKPPVSPKPSAPAVAAPKPAAGETKPPDRPRNQPYMFISSRPADKVANEVSVMVGYPLKPSSEATAEVGSTTFQLYTLNDGAWIKNAAEEAHMVDAMRAGDSAVVKGTSAKGTESIDTYSLKGLTEALDRVAQECK
jgi:invasion protein IalB